FISGKRSDRQGITRNSDITVMSTLMNAQRYIMSKSVAPGKQEETLVAAAEGMINAALQRINHFYANEWTAYRKLVEGTRVSLFKEYKPLEPVQ
ncbi:MAG TPA: hypothetical protein VGE66_11595, partial [Chitinophagaceae bacterium]